MANNSVVTQEKLQEFYDTKIYDYLNGATHTGCVPLGTILPYFGETAPTHFLICDGTEYAKADYPELAEHLLALTDPTPYEGSDANHFKVPDLRGEFLRGTGTNSHSNQGSGSTVGMHQDATAVDGNYQNVSDKVLRVGQVSAWNGGNRNGDSDLTVEGFTQYFTSSAQTINESNYTLQTVRPTNTSVTYIIAYRNAYIDLALDSFPIDISNPTDGQLLMYDATAGRWVNGGHKYSTDEHLVGTWIDGKPIYEKTILATMPDASETKSVAHGISNFKMVISFTGAGYNSNGARLILPYTGDGYEQNYTRQTLFTFDNTNIYMRNYGVDRSSYTAYLTLRYTKTTDTV